MRTLIQKVRAAARTLWCELCSWHNRSVEKKYDVSKKKEPWLFWGVSCASVIFILFGSWKYVEPLFNLLSPTLLAQVATATLSYSSPDAIGGPDPKCNVFKVNEWERGQGLLEYVNNIWSVATSSPNGLLRYEKPIKLDSDVSITFASFSEKQVNVVVTAHGLYEASIGDGDYRGINVKTWNSEGEPRFIPDDSGQVKNVFSMRRGEEYKIVLNQGISRLDDGSYELNLRVGQSPSWGNDTSPLFATYNIPLPRELRNSDSLTRFSVGLKAASDGSKVAAEFYCVNFD